MTTIIENKYLKKKRETRGTLKYSTGQGYNQKRFDSQKSPWINNLTFSTNKFQGEKTIDNRQKPSALIGPYFNSDSNSKLLKIRKFLKMVTVRQLEIKHLLDIMAKNWQ